MLSFDDNKAPLLSSSRASHHSSALDILLPSFIPSSKPTPNPPPTALADPHFSSGSLIAKSAMSEATNVGEAPEKPDGPKGEAPKELESPEVPEAPARIERAREAQKEHAKLECPPTRLELIGWCAYGLCSYFVHTVLIPILFPLIITQRASPASDLSPPPAYTSMGVVCSQKEMTLYQRLTNHSITVNGAKFSPLHWTAISWTAGILLAVPFLTHIAHYLDHGAYQPQLLGSATAVAAFCCFLTGFFKPIGLFPVYIAAIAIAAIVGTATHSRNQGLMIRGLTAHVTGKHHFPRRRAAASRLSLCCTTAGSTGAAIMAAFTYHMLRRSDQLTTLWVVFLFSGLQLLLGICHAVFLNRPGSSSPIPSNKCAHIFAIARYPHAIGSLVAVFSSSFSSICIFTASTLYIIGDLCVKPVILLALWIVYFMFPLVSLPMLHLVQLVIRAEAKNMQLLGFFMSAFTSGLGFYYKDEKWEQVHMILVGLVQSTAAGVLHAFGRVLLLDCSPAGKEGAFSVWLACVRAAGACAGFAVGSEVPENIGRSFGVAFFVSFAGVAVLIFGNVSNLGGAVAAGHVEEEEEEGREEGSTFGGLERVGEGVGSNLDERKGGHERGGA